MNNIINHSENNKSSLINLFRNKIERIKHGVKIEILSLIEDPFGLKQDAWKEYKIKVHIAENLARHGCEYHFPEPPNFPCPSSESKIIRCLFKIKDSIENIFPNKPKKIAKIYSKAKKEKR